MAAVITPAFRHRLPATACRVTLRARATFGRMDFMFMDPTGITGVQADGHVRRARMPNGFQVNGIAIAADTGYAEGTGDRPRRRIVSVLRGATAEATVQPGLYK